MAIRAIVGAPWLIRYQQYKPRYIARLTHDLSTIKSLQTEQNSAWVAIQTNLLFVVGRPMVRQKPAIHADLLAAKDFTKTAQGGKPWAVESAALPRFSQLLPP